MNEHEFTDTIEHATGKKLGIDYCFVMGTMTPWPTKSGMQSATAVNGFYINRKENDGSWTEKLLSPLNQQESLSQIIEFLKDTN